MYSRLFRVVQLSDDELAKGLGKYGLRQGWFDLLAALRRAGRRIRRQYRRATLLSSSRDDQRLDRMEEAGLIERRPDPNDRRGRSCASLAAARMSSTGRLRRT